MGEQNADVLAVDLFTSLKEHLALGAVESLDFLLMVLTQWPGLY